MKTGGGLAFARTPRPTRPNNRWLDCLVGCAAAPGLRDVKSPLSAALEKWMAEQDDPGAAAETSKRRA